MADFAELRHDPSRLVSISDAERDARHFLEHGKLPPEFNSMHRDLLEDVGIREASQGFVYFFCNPDTGCEGGVELDIVLDDYGDRPEWVPQCYPIAYHNEDCNCRWFGSTDDILGYMDVEHTGNTGEEIHVFPWDLQAFARSKVEDGTLEPHYEALVICKLHLRMSLPDELRYPESMEAYYSAYGEAVSMRGGESPYLVRQR